MRDSPKALLIPAYEVQPGDTIISHRHGTHVIAELQPWKQQVKLRLDTGAVIQVKKNFEILVARRSATMNEIGKYAAEAIIQHIYKPMIKKLNEDRTAP